MSCYDNYFLLRAACGTIKSKSGLYVEDIPGMNVVTIAATASPDAQSAVDVVRETVRAAFTRFSSDLQTELSANWGARAIDYVNGLKFQENFELADIGDAGGMFRFSRTSLSRLRIHRLYFRSESSVVDKNITISDGINTVIYQVTAQPGEEVAIDVDFTSVTSPVRISYDMSDVQPFVGDLTGHSRFACGSCTEGSERIAFYGFKPGISQSSNAYGLLADASLECDYEKATCLVSPMMKYELLLLFGHMLLEQRIASNRLNAIRIQSVEWAKEKSPEFEKKYLKKLKDSSIALRDYLQRVDPTCIICKGIQIQYSV